MRNLYVSRMILAVVLVALALSFAGCTRYGHDGRYSRYQSVSEAYRYGHQEGYRHGYEDRRRGAGYDYRHSQRYRSGISRNRQINSAFRDGYVRGYNDGYYGRRRY